MSTTNSVTNNSASVPSAGLSGTPANQQISQTDFLKIITAQLTDQNPLSPTDPTQFVTQLEGMSEVSAMQSMQGSMQASSIMSGAGLIGRNVLAPGTQATLAAGGNIGGAVTAPQGTTAIQVTITDSTGAYVNSMNVTPADTGLTSFVWNGQTSTGTAAAAGTYNIAVNAVVNGVTTPVAPMVVNKVDSVLVDPTTNAVDVQTDNSTVPLSQIVSVM
jgi:flagellar basal-body rod modification protein FlgD